MEASFEHLSNLCNWMHRDQRTAKTRYCDRQSRAVENLLKKQESDINHDTFVIDCSFQRRASPCSSHLTSKKGYIWNSIQRLKSVQLIVIYLSLIVTFPIFSTAPISQMDKFTSKPLWVDPCGNPQIVDDPNYAGSSTEAETNKDLLQKVIHSANTALLKVNTFKDDFANYTFNSEDQARSFKNFNYNWLPNLPKQMGENLPAEHLEKLKLKETLLDAYTALQTVAVGMEQVNHDQHHGDKYKDKLHEAELLLRNVLCELHTAILDHGVEMRPNVQRDVMTSEYRDSSNRTLNKVRDWVILREYVNNLECVVEELEYFKKE